MSGSAGYAPALRFKVCIERLVQMKPSEEIEILDVPVSWQDITEHINLAC